MGKGLKKEAQHLERMKLFVRAYMVDFNGKGAAIQVGISPASAADKASRWLKEPLVQRLFQEYMGELINNQDVKVHNVIKELGHIGFSSVSNYTKKDEAGQLHIDTTDTTEDQMRAVKSVRTKERVIMQTFGDDGQVLSRVVSRETHLELWDKNSALDKLLRTLGGYVGKETPGVTVNNESGGNVNVLQQSVNITPQEAADAYRKMLDG